MTRGNEILLLLRLFLYCLVLLAEAVTDREEVPTPLLVHVPHVRFLTGVFGVWYLQMVISDQHSERNDRMKSSHEPHNVCHVIEILRDFDVFQSVRVFLLFRIRNRMDPRQTYPPTCPPLFDRYLLRPRSATLYLVEQQHEIDAKGENQSNVFQVIEIPGQERYNAVSVLGQIDTGRRGFSRWFLLRFCFHRSHRCLLRSCCFGSGCSLSSCLFDSSGVGGKAGSTLPAEFSSDQRVKQDPEYANLSSTAGFSRKGVDPLNDGLGNEEILIAATDRVSIVYLIDLDGLVQGLHHVIPYDVQGEMRAVEAPYVLDRLIARRNFSSCRLLVMGFTSSFGLNVGPYRWFGRLRFGLRRLRFTRKEPTIDVISFRRVDKNAVEYVQHSSSLAGSLRAQSTEQPIQTITVGKLSAVRVISFDDRGQQLVQVSGYLVPCLPALVPRKRHQKSLRSDYVDLVDGLQDQIQYAFFLEQVLTVSQSSEPVLFLLVETFVTAVEKSQHVAAEHITDVLHSADSSPIRLHGPMGHVERGIHHRQIVLFGGMLKII
ncbi:hypothetical protein WN55_02785 [Dufourea novaeangliae]|uniref:Secreted protein n=1 Tax=Dufourea novaeangliae TaxID=178035 RepID=A0A154NXY8_DUFNO|nr:hypothetical protein WN55_02785 [Dufourea novaeangliae]